MRVIFQLSTNCNLRCTYCYQKHHDSAVMPFEYAQKLLDDLFLYKTTGQGYIFQFITTNIEIVQKEVVELDFFGGECTLYIDLIEQIVEYFEQLCDKYHQDKWKKEYEIWVETNGTTFLNPKVYSFYKKYKDRLDVPITIDGCKECHDKCRVTPSGEGSYDIVEAGVKEHFNLFGYQPNTKLTFCKDNMRYMKDIVQNLVSLGYTSVRGSWDGLDVSMSAEDSYEYYKYMKEAIDYIIDNKIPFAMWILRYATEEMFGEFNPPNCGCLGGQVVLKWDGKIYFCQQLNESFLNDKDKEFCLGDIEHGITNLDRLRNYQQAYRDAIFDWECNDCPLKNICEPCPATNLAVGNDMQHYAFNCGVGVAIVRALVYYAKRAEETDYPYFKSTFQLIRNTFKDGLPDRKYKIEVLHPEE